MDILKTLLTLREKYLLLGVDKLKIFYVDLIHPNRKTWKESTTSLSLYAEGSLGKELYNFLEKGNIDLVPKYESHDVYHILTGYGLGLDNESRMFFFLLGNGKRSISVLGTIIVALVFIPERWSQFYKDYKRGKEFHPMKNIDFEKILDTNYQTLVKSLKK